MNYVDIKFTKKQVDLLLTLFESGEPHITIGQVFLFANKKGATLRVYKLGNKLLNIINEIIRLTSNGFQL